MRWLEGRALDATHIKTSKIYKVVYQVARLDEEHLSESQRKLVCRARDLHKKWMSIVHIDTASLRAPLTPPTFSQLVSRPEPFPTLTSSQASMLEGWVDDFSSPPL